MRIYFFTLSVAADVSPFIFEYMYLTKKSNPQKLYPYLDEEDSSKWNVDSWRLDVGAECNELLEWAEEFEMTGSSEHKPGMTHEQFAGVLRSIVGRVANFEELETE
jgi:hypothetical protein